MSNSIILNSKRLLVTGVITVGVLVSPLGILQSVNAQSVSSSSTSSTSSSAPKNSQDRMLRIKNAGDSEINKRLTSLRDVIAKLNDAKHLSTSQKATFTSNINTEINNLTTLQTKIDSDTDLTTLRTDVKSVVQSYRVYALYIPQTRLTIAADKIIEVNGTFTDLANKLNIKIQNAKTQGKDVSALVTAYNDIITKLADSITQSNNAVSIVTPLIPAGYPGNVTQLQQSKTNIKTAFADLKTARVDVKTIINGLKQFKTTSSSTSSSTSSVNSSSSASVQ